MIYSTDIARAVANAVLDVIFGAEDPEDLPTVQLMSGGEDGETLVTFEFTREQCDISNDGDLTLAIGASHTGEKDGQAEICTVFDGDGKDHLSLPVSDNPPPEGESLPGYCLVNTKAITAGALISITDFLIPAQEKL